MGFGKIFKEVGKSFISGGGGLGQIFGTISGPNGANFMDPLDITGTTARNFQDQQARADREWQEQMSNTAHQREMADLEKAGLNPVLTANGGNGASTPGGAMAGQATGSGIGDLVGLINAFSTIKANKTTARQVESQASLNSTTEKDILNQMQNRNIKTAQDVQESQSRIGKIAEETRIAQVEADRKALEYAKDKPILESERSYNETAVAEYGVQARRLYEDYGKWADLLIKAFGVAGGLKALGALKANGITKITSFQQLESELSALTRSGKILKPF